MLHFELSKTQRRNAMLGIMNTVIRTATGADSRRETGFEREYRIRHADRVSRAEAELELERRLRSRFAP
tara:strand:+ start:80174 stop:80380 length:207 start_codon:yes stop_codon:yes gene_type:complete